MELTRETFGNIPEFSRILFYVWASRRAAFGPTAYSAACVCGGSAGKGGAGSVRAACWTVFSSEVLGQRRVVRRRLAGWAHFCLFWGFFLLFIGTLLLMLEHWAVAISPALHFHYGIYYVVYKITLDTAGIALIVGCAVLGLSPVETSVVSGAQLARLGDSGGLVHDGRQRLRRGGFAPLVVQAAAARNLLRRLRSGPTDRQRFFGSSPPQRPFLALVGARVVGADDRGGVSLCPPVPRHRRHTEHHGGARRVGRHAAGFPRGGGTDRPCWSGKHRGFCLRVRFFSWTRAWSAAAVRKHAPRTPAASR